MCFSKRTLFCRCGYDWYGGDLDNEDKLPEDEEGNEYETDDLAVCLNMCVEERGEERYCWRAGVMSRDEGGEEGELFVWTVFFSLKARSLSRETVVREGMSVCEVKGIRSTLQNDDARIAECTTVYPFSGD